MKEHEPTPIRWGIAGCGRIAQRFLSSARCLPATSVVAAASRTPGKAEAFARANGISRHHDSYEELAADPEIDAVYVANLHHQHLDAALLALRGRKAVLCEKPLTLNARQALTMVECARLNGVFLMEAMWTRFLPAIAQARDWIAGGRIGEVRKFEAGFGFKAAPGSSRLTEPGLSGGALLDLGVYPLSFASMLFGPGRPAGIQSLVEKLSTGVDAHAAILLDYGGGRFASLGCSINCHLPNSGDIIGTAGRIHLPVAFGGAQEVRLIHAGETLIRRFDEPAERMFRHEVAEVNRCLREGLRESPFMPLDESVVIMETMDALRAEWGVVYPGE